MTQRWYDKDPTLSMAISLLHNASAAHQEMAARYMFKVMDTQNLLDIEELRTKEDRVRFMFPSFRRSQFEMHARQLVELMKHLPPEHQQEVAVQLINYIYILDCGMTDFPLPGEEETVERLVQPESG